MILSNQRTPPGHSPWLSFYDLNLQKTFFSLVAQAVKNPPAMWETQVQSLGWENLLEKGMTTHASILARRVPMDRGAWRLTVQRVAE